MGLGDKAPALLFSIYGKFVLFHDRLQQSCPSILYEIILKNYNQLFWGRKRGGNPGSDLIIIAWKCRYRKSYCAAYVRSWTHFWANQMAHLSSPTSLLFQSPVGLQSASGSVQLSTAHPFHWSSPCLFPSASDSNYPGHLRFSQAVALGKPTVVDAMTVPLGKGDFICLVALAKTHFCT